MTTKHRTAFELLLALILYIAASFCLHLSDVEKSTEDEYLRRSGITIDWVYRTTKWDVAAVLFLCAGSIALLVAFLQFKQQRAENARMPYLTK